jgi:hypothetical protein
VSARNPPFALPGAGQDQDRRRDGRRTTVGGSATAPTSPRPRLTAAFSLDPRQRRHYRARRPGRAGAAPWPVQAELTIPNGPRSPLRGMARPGRAPSGSGGEV